jgi:hypothetical protein
LCLLLFAGQPIQRPALSRCSLKGSGEPCRTGRLPYNFKPPTIRAQGYSPGPTSFTRQWAVGALKASSSLRFFSQLRTLLSLDHIKSPGSQTTGHGKAAGLSSSTVKPRPSRNSVFPADFIFLIWTVAATHWKLCMQARGYPWLRVWRSACAVLNCWPRSSCTLAFHIPVTNTFDSSLERQQSLFAVGRISPCSLAASFFRIRVIGPLLAFQRIFIGRKVHTMYGTVIVSARQGVCTRVLIANILLSVKQVLSATL